MPNALKWVMGLVVGLGIFATYRMVKAPAVVPNPEP